MDIDLYGCSCDQKVGKSIKSACIVYIESLACRLLNKAPRRRVKEKLRSDRSIAVRLLEIWAMDFVHDQLVTGRKLRKLTVVDTYSRYCPVIDPRFSYRGEDVVNTLERVCSEIVYPKVISVDQGTEFVTLNMDV